MAVPTYDRFIEPVLRFLATRPNGAAARDVHEAAAQALGLSEADRQEFAGEHAAALSRQEIERLAFGFIDVRLKPSSAGEAMASAALVAAPVASSSVASPDDRLAEAPSEIRSSVAAELLDHLGSASPSFFETVVLDLLHRMGYGASRADLQRVGGSGDGGIDGVIALDKLGLEKVYVQAKRWQGTVGRPDVQGFYGALAGQRANKGVFITASSFTAQAVEFARSVERVVLVDGPRLTELMMGHDVGVSARSVRIPKVDNDYFDEEST